MNDGPSSTLSRRWRLKKQTFARHLELRSGRPETANRVFGSYVRHHDRDWRTEAPFAVRRTPSRAQILGVPPGCARTSIACSSTSRNPCRADLYYSRSADSILVLPLKKGYPAAVQPILEVRAKQYNLFGVHVARLIHADLDPTNNIVFGLDAHSFFPITQQTADCCANRRCRGVFVEQFNSITRFEI